MSTPKDTYLPPQAYSLALGKGVPTGQGLMYTNPKERKEDEILDKTLRPYNFEEYFGQEKIKKNLKVLLEAAKQRKEAVEHILLHGGSGLGKTTLAYIIARELGTNIRITSGPAIEKIGDLASILTNLQEGDVLFIDECHRLNKLIEEYIYPAMEEFSLNIIIGKGPSARTIQLDLPPFTLIAATTRISLLSSPLRNRFGATYHLDFYEPKDIENIVKRSSKILKVETGGSGIKEIAKRARRTPRVANRLLKRVRDYAQVHGQGKITKEIAQKALAMLEIDDLGLEPVDRLIIKTIIEKFGGGPVGLDTLAAATSEEKDTICEIYEPYLMQIGFLARTPQGRVVTNVGYKHLKLRLPKEEQKKLIE